MLQSKGTVRRIIEDKDGFLVSFLTHDGYFHLDDGTLRDRASKAKEEGREVAFAFDRTLKIISVTQV